MMVITLGVRPCFVAEDEFGFGYCSEMRSLVDITDPSTIQQLRGGTILEYSIDAEGESTTQTRTYYDPAEVKFEPSTLETALKDVRDEFTDAVECRLESDRPLAALLSGGLDSSLVVAIAANYLKKHGKRLSTYSIGIPGSTDREYAELVILP